MVFLPYGDKKLDEHIIHVVPTGEHMRVVEHDPNNTHMEITNGFPICVSIIKYRRTVNDTEHPDMICGMSGGFRGVGCSL